MYYLCQVLTEPPQNLNHHHLHSCQQGEIIHFKRKTNCRAALTLFCKSSIFESSIGLARGVKYVTGQKRKVRMTFSGFRPFVRQKHMMMRSHWFLLALRPCPSKHRSEGFQIELHRGVFYVTIKTNPFSSNISWLKVFCLLVNFLLIYFLKRSYQGGNWYSP